MARVFWAEWVIARLTDQKRAASIVGDLLEAATEQGMLWFWLSLAGIVLSLIWRPVLAFVAAFFCFSLLRALPMPVFAALHGLPPSHQPAGIWVPFFVVLGRLGMLLWVAAPYAAVRYGFRDGFAQLAMALCVPITTAIFYWWIPGIVVTCMALSLSILVSSVVFKRRHSSLLALALALVLGYFGVQLTLYVAEWYLELAPPSAILTSLVNTDLAPFFGAAILTIACAFMHHFLPRCDQLGHQLLGNPADNS